jgi:hypothetical protein
MLYQSHLTLNKKTINHILLTLDKARLSSLKLHIGVQNHI